MSNAIAQNILLLVCLAGISLFLSLPFSSVCKLKHILFLTFLFTFILYCLLQSYNRYKLEKAKTFLLTANNKKIALKCFNQINIYNKCYEYNAYVNKYAFISYDFLNVVSYDSKYSQILDDNIYCKALKIKNNDSEMDTNFSLKQIAIEQNQARCNAESAQIAEILSKSN